MNQYAAYMWDVYACVCVCMCAYVKIVGETQWLHSLIFTSEISLNLTRIFQQKNHKICFVFFSVFIKEEVKCLTVDLFQNDYVLLGAIYIVFYVHCGYVHTFKHVMCLSA